MQPKMSAQSRAQYFIIYFVSYRQMTSIYVMSYLVFGHVIHVHCQQYLVIICIKETH